MNSTQIRTVFGSILSCLEVGELRKSFEYTHQLISELQNGEFIDRHNDLEQNYSFLLEYYIKDIEDAQRKTIFNKLKAKVFSLASEVYEELMFRNSTNFEYTQKRYFPHRLKFSSYNDLFDALNYYRIQEQLLKDSKNLNDSSLPKLRSNFEGLLPDLFSIFWLTSFYGNIEKSLFQKIISNEFEGETEKALTITALTLNLWRMFDENKILLLIECCNHKNQTIRLRSLVGLCFILVKYNLFISNFPHIRNRLMLLVDDTYSAETLKNILLQIISTLETDKITKKLNEEILPEVMKMSPMIKDKLDAENLMKSDEWEETNPEWEEILEKSGISEKLQELSELQREGADVYMGTFSLLKSFPFFNEISNWFLPFDNQFSAINPLFRNQNQAILSAFLSNNVMCNSDKYSFCLSILQMPESQRNMISQAFTKEAEQLSEISKDEEILNPHSLEKYQTKQYIQDLFRFFRLFPHHNDFTDMFSYALQMHRSYLFDLLCNSTELKNTISDFYFTKSYYPQAIELLQSLSEESNSQAAIFQKLGFAQQKNSQIKEALQSYLKADIIQPDDLWTIKKIALCYKLSGEYNKALDFYQHANFLKPNQQNILLNLAQCHIELNQYKEALSIYAQLDTNYDNNIKVWKAASHCSFIAKDLAQADYYNQQCIDLNPDATDFILAGHIAWCKKEIHKAFSSYLKASTLAQTKMETIVNQIMIDKPNLLAFGIDKDEISFMTDKLLYSTTSTTLL